MFFIFMQDYFEYLMINEFIVQYCDVICVNVMLYVGSVL